MSGIRNLFKPKDFNRYSSEGHWSIAQKILNEYLDKHTIKAYSYDGKRDWKKYEPYDGHSLYNFEALLLDIKPIEKKDLNQCAHKHIEYTGVGVSICRNCRHEVELEEIKWRVVKK